jgi:hypothetical protein
MQQDYARTRTIGAPKSVLNNYTIDNNTRETKWLSLAQRPKR